MSNKIPAISAVALLYLYFLSPLTMTKVYAAEFDAQDLIGKSMFWHSQEDGKTTLINFHDDRKLPSNIRSAKSGFASEDFRATMHLASVESGDTFQLLKGYANQVKRDWQGPQGKMAAFMAGIFVTAGNSSSGGAGSDESWKRGRANGHCGTPNC